ncbi:MAG TPA: hypothetical protein PLH65_02510 [bacterium]|nr:hypothetical protein [bacterium]
MGKLEKNWDDCDRITGEKSMMEKLAEYEKIEALRNKLSGVEKELEKKYHTVRSDLSGQELYRFYQDELGKNELCRLIVGNLNEYDEGPEWGVDFDYGDSWTMIMKLNDKNEYEFETEGEVVDDLWEDFQKICQKLVRK